MRPVREKFRNTEAAYFISTQTAGRKPFFRHERWACLMMAVLGLKPMVLKDTDVWPEGRTFRIEADALKGQTIDFQRR